MLLFWTSKTEKCIAAKWFACLSLAHSLIYTNTRMTYLCAHTTMHVYYTSFKCVELILIFFRRWLKYIHNKRVDNWGFKWKCTCGDTVIHLIASFDLFTWLLSTNIQMLRTNLLIVHADRRPDWWNYFCESSNSIAVTTPTTMPKKTNHMIE